MLFRPPPLDWGGTNPPPPGVSSFASAVNSVISLAHRVSSRRAGIVIAGIAIVFSAPDATLLRCLQQDGTPNSTIFLWKMAVYTVVQAAFAIQQDGSLRRVLRLTCDSWPWMLIGSLALCVEWFATLANLTTSSASALCLFYIAPLWAVPMGMLVNSDALHARTLVAMAVALIGILLIFAPNVLSSTTGKPHPVAHIRPLRHGQHRNDSSLSGDLCGLASGLAFAAWITTCRHASLHKPDTPLALCGAIGTLFLVLPAIPASIFRGDDLFDVTPRFVVLVLLDCAAIAAYNIGTMIASKYLPSAELGLYLTLDVVFAPLLVWAVHGEVPTSAVLVGGGLLVGALVAHEIIAVLRPDAPAALQGVEMGQLSPKNRLKNSGVNLAGMNGNHDESTQPLFGGNEGK
jgi:drug/metabolite transporter (DMT)-like permease